MSKEVIIGGVLLGGGLVAYLVFKHLNLNAPAANAAPAPASVGGQPAQQNQSQPWYVGDLQGLEKQAAAGFQSNPLGTLQAAASGIKSLSDITGSISSLKNTIGSWFGSSSSAGSGDSLPSTSSSDLSGSGLTPPNDLFTSTDANNYSSPASFGVSFDNSSAGLPSASNADAMSNLGF